MANARATSCMHAHTSITCVSAYQYARCCMRYIKMHTGFLHSNTQLHKRSSKHSPTDSHKHMPPSLMHTCWQAHTHSHLRTAPTDDIPISSTHTGLIYEDKISILNQKHNFRWHYIHVYYIHSCRSFKGLIIFFCQIWIHETSGLLRAGKTLFKPMIYNEAFLFLRAIRPLRILLIV